MNELKISIENINPAVLWGPNNDHFEIIKKQYPKLKIVARGSEVKVLGDERELVIFEEKFNHLIQHIEKFENLNITDLERVLGSKADINAPADAAADKFASGEVIVFGPNGVMVKARTANQRKMVDCINKSDILFAIGPAGTGKTYTAVALAVRALKNKEIKRIILTRPAVEACENLGFLPGDLKEKIDPYLRPLYDALDDMIPAEKLKLYLENRTIEIAPLAFMRGRTLDNCFVILDEAQNATDMQLKMFLTRM
ncbi:MAG: ybeZ 1, partial [Mucilaginibacter sp.]|nr:ybeZ 1 [Mucilaginibacter sp.]